MRVVTLVVFVSAVYIVVFWGWKDRAECYDPVGVF